MRIFATLNDENRIVDIVSEQTPEFNELDENKLFELTEELHLEIWKSGSNGNWKLSNGQILYDPVPLPEPIPSVTQPSGEIPGSIL